MLNNAQIIVKRVILKVSARNVTLVIMVPTVLKCAHLIAWRVCVNYLTESVHMVAKVQTIEISSVVLIEMVQMFVRE